MSDDDSTSPPVGGPSSEETQPVAPAPGAAPSDAPLALPTESLSDYELLDELGRGGMGVVYRARQRSLHRLVAVKMIRADRLASEEEITRFYREARAAGRLRHPNIVPIYAVGEDQGRHFYSMGLVEGKTLADLASEHSLSAREIAQCMKSVAEAVDYAHQNGVLHRDLKPANILLDASGAPHITDFGLAKQLDEDAGLTASGAIMGSPSYMPPEQAAGKLSEVGPASDVYSLGAILYVLLTGRPPLQGASMLETVRKVMEEHPADPWKIQPGADRQLAAVCLKCLNKAPADRYPTAQALADEMDRYLAGAPVLARPLGPLARLGRWLQEVPLVAALVGRNLSPATRRQFQLQSLALLLVSLALGIWFLLPERMPAQVRIAGGEPGGVYDQFSRDFARDLAEGAQRPVQAIETRGSGDNRRLLLEGGAELALLQASDLTSQRLAVVAPLYYEVAQPIARRQSGLARLGDLKTPRPDGRAWAVGLGAAGSGTRSVARKALAHVGVSESELIDIDRSFLNLQGAGPLDAAFAVSGTADPRLKRLFASGDFVLLAIDDLDQLVLREGSLKRYTVRADFYAPGAPADDLPLPATPALLVCRSNAPRPLVQRTLRALYRRPRPGQISLEEAKESWPMLPFHAAARDFFEAAEAGDPSGDRN